MRRQIAATLWVVTASQASPPSAAAATAAGAPAPAQESAHATPGNGQTAGWSAEYGDKGLEIASPGGGWRFEPAVRVQLRYSDPFDDDPRTIAAIDMPPGSDFEIRRARFKLDTQLGAEWLTLYSETELDGPVQLDLRVTIEPERSVRRALRPMEGGVQPRAARFVGLRCSSSTGRSSIVNSRSTGSRARCCSAASRRGGAADVSAWAGVFGGAGRGHFNDGGEPMYLAARPVEPERPRARVLAERCRTPARGARGLQSPSRPCAIAAATRASRRMAVAISMASPRARSTSTRSSNGWSNRHTSGAAFRGSRNGTRRPSMIASPARRRVIRGLYAQAGYFLSRGLVRLAPTAGTGIAVRDRRSGCRHRGSSRRTDLRRELVLQRPSPTSSTPDVSRLEVDDPDGAAHDWRVRLQWDVTL